MTLGTYFRIMPALSLDKDFELLAADDAVGRRLQDLEMDPAPRKRTTARALP